MIKDILNSTCYVFFTAEQRFEVFNVETKLLLTKTKIHDPVCYWTWLNSDIIAIVTDTAVFHWSLFKTSKFEKRNIRKISEIKILSIVEPVFCSQ